MSEREQSEAPGGSPGGALGDARLGGLQDAGFRRLNDSLSFDQRLWPQDVALSRAHARMLASSGIITEPERDLLLDGLAQVQQELAAGKMGFGEGDEDIHMAIERRLIELIGLVGGKLHTARSRNDQVATDVALFTRQSAEQCRESLRALMGALLAKARAHLDWLMPGYTHLQRAQPVYLAHHLLAYFWMFARDEQRFAFTFQQAGRMPLGSGALAGTGFPIDRAQVAAELGFSELAPNSIDAVASRDFVLDFLSAAATTATHLSRLGAELVLFSSQEFGFCELPDAWSATSSIMPQKKNPDAAELLRAKAPRLAAHLAAMHGVLHALPLAYNKDLQEDKEHLFDAFDTLQLTLCAAKEMIDGVRFDAERMREAAAEESLAATEIADLLVTRGLPFREAHGVVAGMVRSALREELSLSDLARSPERLAAISPQLAAAGPELAELLGSPRAWVQSKRSPAGSASERVQEQILQAQELLDRLA